MHIVLEAGGSGNLSDGSDLCARDLESIERVHRLLERNDPQQALAMAGAVSDPYHRNTLAGICESALGNRSIERELFQRALSHAGSDPRKQSKALANLSDTELLAGSPIEAEILARRALALHSQRPTPWLNLLQAIETQADAEPKMQLRFETEIRRMQILWPAGTRDSILHHAIANTQGHERLLSYLSARATRLREKSADNARAGERLVTLSQPSTSCSSGHGT